MDYKFLQRYLIIITLLAYKSYAKKRLKLDTTIKLKPYQLHAQKMIKEIFLEKKMQYFRRQE